MQDCELSLLYRLADIGEYLTKVSDILNGITVLDRSFVEMKILSSIFTATSLVGEKHIKSLV